MSDVTESPDEAEEKLPPPKNAAEFIDRILSEAGISREDFEDAPGELAYYDTVSARAFGPLVPGSTVKDFTWQFNEGVPAQKSQTIIYIARDDDERRIYSAPVPRASMTPADLKLLEADYKAGKAYCICWHISPLGVDMEAMDLDAFLFLVGKDVRRTVDEFVGASEFDNALAYLKGLPAGTPLPVAIKGLEDEEHMEDVEEETPNGVGAPPVATAPKQPMATS
jgi:hypothetical protein